MVHCVFGGRGVLGFSLGFFGAKLSCRMPPCGCGHVVDVGGGPVEGLEVHGVKIEAR